MQRPPFVAFRLNEEELNFVERTFEEYQVREKMEMGKIGGSNSWGQPLGGQNDQIRRSNIHFMKAMGPIKEFIWKLKPDTLIPIHCDSTDRKIFEELHPNCKMLNDGEIWEV